MFCRGLELKRVYRHMYGMLKFLLLPCIGIHKGLEMLLRRGLSSSVWYGEWIMGTIIGDYIGATLGIIPPFPTKHQTVLRIRRGLGRRFQFS